MAVERLSPMMPGVFAFLRRDHVVKIYFAQAGRSRDCFFA
ncbi:hypothetical protein CSUI_010084 [Cystoisospora suis]|uniref:Uncharacterized protein n=1 Tax=Cystoisospora suis TaxID=483139 RepID=A0A2C6KI86_9APIC|nr:hypothetical protein CSUI_010084 [Cystoisospora suis]